MNTVNKPKVSKTITIVYEILVIFIMAVAAFFLYTIYTPMGIMGVIASIISVLIGIIILLILLSFYKTRYILTDSELIIKTTKLIGGKKNIPLKTIKSVEPTIIPFGIRLYGASFHGGYYHIPGLGRVFMCLTNFNDGLLIRTVTGTYIITPSNPANFKEILENNISQAREASQTPPL